MRYPLLALFSSSICAASLVLSGCSSSLMSPNSPAPTGTAPTGAPPTVVAVGEQVNGVAPNRKQEVQFSEAMDASTINTQSFQVTDSSGKLMPGTVSYDPDFNTASFLPNPALQTGATYTATITTAVASAGGMHLASPYSYTFATRSTTDTSPLSVESVVPAANATCVSPTTPITITFNEAPDASTVNSTNIAVTGPGGAVIPVTMSINVTTTQVVLTPNAPFPSGTITVTVQNVADLAGVRIAAPYSWSFSTVCTGGGGGGAKTQYMAQLFSESALDTTINGQVTVDMSGNTTVTLTGGAASSTFTVQFCPGFDAGATTIPAPNCINVTTISTDASGNGSATAKFPQSGDWAGDFDLSDSTGKMIYQTFLTSSISSESYMATLLPETMTNGGAVTNLSPQDPLSSGTISYSRGVLQVFVSGASPSTTYSIRESETAYMDSSGTYTIAGFTTIASGDGAGGVTSLNYAGGDLFQIEPQTGAGFIGGFSVP